ncbi:thymidine kinase [bacterium]|nr:thymidine kinase [bacterium]
MFDFPHDTGWIEVICGPMFSGKTEELIRRLRRAQIAKQRVAIFKAGIDTRYEEDQLVSHSQQKIPSIGVRNAWDILTHAKDADVFGVDEAQFLGIELVEVAAELAGDRKRVIIAGLDTDYRGLPFEPIPQLLAIAEYITKELAICVQCGNPAKFTQRIVESGELILVGAQEAYEPRCRRCFRPPDAIYSVKNQLSLTELKK